MTIDKRTDKEKTWDRLSETANQRMFREIMVQFEDVTFVQGTTELSFKELETVIIEKNLLGNLGEKNGTT